MERNLLFTKNDTTENIKKLYKDKKYVFSNSRTILDDILLKQIISVVNTGTKTIRLPIVFNLGKVRLEDKISYILLEYICYYIIKVQKSKCCVFVKFEDSIASYAAKSSPLHLLDVRNVFGSHKTYKVISEEYVKKFEKNIELRHIRKIIKKEEWGTAEASKINTTIHQTFSHLAIDDKQADQICEMIGELIDNSGEHAQSDCLIDVDITPDHIKKDNTGLYYGVNIVIFDFSAQLLGEKIKDILQSGIDNNEWYDKLEDAREFHKNLWCDTYTESDFFIMSAFQNRISSRRTKYTTGGTGLTRLVAALELQSDAYQCFVWTGNRKMEFKHDLLKLDDRGWVGFNQYKDFLNTPPEATILNNANVFFPGTAYNLSFILRRE